MKKLLIALLLCSICSIGLANDQQVTITLDDDQQDAWENMLDVNTGGLQAALQDYIVSIADAHVSQRLQEELNKMTTEEVKAAIPNFKVKKEK